MKRIAIATVGVVASLATLSSAAQLQARGLPVVHMAAEVEADLVNRISAQVEDNFWTQFKEYFHKYPNGTAEVKAEVEKHQLPPYIEKEIGQYIKAEATTEDIFGDIKNKLRE